MSDVAEWFRENRENLAGLYGIPTLPADATPEEALEWMSGVLKEDHLCGCLLQQNLDGETVIDDRCEEHEDA